MFNYLIIRTDHNYNRSLETEDGTIVDTHREITFTEPDVWALGDAMYYLARTEEDANRILEKLCNKFPGVTWGMFALNKSGRAPAGPVQYTIVNDKGVLPA